MEGAWKRGFILGVVATVIAVGGLFAAGQGEAASQTDERMEITWMYRHKDSWLIHELNDKFNVEIVSNGVYMWDGEQYNLMIASGEAPEVFAGGDGVEYYFDGLTRTISEEMIRTNAPGIAKLFDERPLAWLVEQAPDTEGYVGIAGMAENTDGPIFWPSTRSDYLEAVGFELPNYQSKKISMDRFDKVYYYDGDFSVDMYEDLLVAFRDGDPDNNGEQDTIPLGASNAIHWSWATLLGAYGLDYTTLLTPQGLGNYIENDVSYVTPTSPRMRQFLKRVHAWYEMGLIDTEFPTLNVRKMWAKVATGRIGMELCSNVSYTGRLPERVPNNWITDEQAASGIDVVILNPPIGPDGYQGVQAYNPVTTIRSTGHALRIRRDVSDAKLARALQIWNYLQSDLEGWIYWYYGKPGSHFEWSGEPWASPGIRKDPKEVPAEDSYNDSTGLQFLNAPVYYTKDQTVQFLYPPALWGWWKDVFYGPKGQELSMHFARYDLFGETDLRSVYEQYGEVLNTMFSEYFTSAIVGEVNTDSDWDAFVASWMKNGGDKVMAELEASPLVDALRAGRIEY